MKRESVRLTRNNVRATGKVEENKVDKGRAAGAGDIGSPSSRQNGSGTLERNALTEVESTSALTADTRDPVPILTRSLGRVSLRKARWWGMETV